ncbi:Ppx/GppA phosphatase family protein [Bifidobacterium actinocoloniiforme DSM 22766]|uniref:Ppx/GppA phosphatase family protein n=1 Tax=Bifidobacterium actinocoloniiforme DSM 22766 TaxID=1437605 RepID=A0A086Z017_9BIFI|nr:Ppx/GppA phosphatase family protein [Bifidobacterium actinocoloniiforme]AKV55135.1 exopolyphosphatase [Bifidobacterium actinocoloniiforme DSM 22766]KFI39867.1 Ppx/GppA phosphatase family protein [Bifidobacterium actinocoloniiforme DSM 22766]
MDAVTVAGVDCGTNSIRLMLAQVDEAGLHPLLPRTMRVIRLGEGVDEHRRFSQEALERAWVAAREFARILAGHQMDAMRFVATSASRDAENRSEFEDGIQDILGVRPEVIAGSEEARLSFLGAVSVLEARRQPADMSPAPYLVVDLGGGSTELVVGGDGGQAPADQAQASYSMNIGSVRMTERHLKSDPAAAGQIRAAQADVDAHIDQAFKQVPVGGVRTLIGVSGTVTTMAALALGLKTYDSQIVDGAQVRMADIQEAGRRVLAMSRSQRAELKAIHPGRVDVIGGGALILNQLLDRLRQEAPDLGTGFVASEHGLLDGMVLDLGRRLLAERARSCSA